MQQPQEPEGKIPQTKEEIFRRMKYEKFQRLVELGITAKNPLAEKEKDQPEDGSDDEQ